MHRERLRSSIKFKLVKFSNNKKYQKLINMLIRTKNKILENCLDMNADTVKPLS